MTSSVNKPLTVLIVEDNLADVFLFKEAAKTIEGPIELHAVTDGQEAFQFLRGEPPFDRATRPDVVVLDLNLPVKSGAEVVGEMASDPALNNIPVVILTTPTSESQVCEVYPPGRCIYFAKTNDFEQLQEIVRQIVEHARNARR